MEFTAHYIVVRRPDISRAVGVPQRIREPPDPRAHGPLCHVAVCDGSKACRVRVCIHMAATLKFEFMDGWRANAAGICARMSGGALGQPHVFVFGASDRCGGHCYEAMLIYICVLERLYDGDLSAHRVAGQEHAWFRRHMPRAPALQMCCWRLQGCADRVVYSL